MPDPNNLADLPPSWRPRPSEAPPVETEKDRAVARRIKNRRHALVLDLADHLVVLISGSGATAKVLDHFTPLDWKKVAKATGHPASKPPSPETRAAVIVKVRERLKAQDQLVADILAERDRLRAERKGER